VTVLGGNGKPIASQIEQQHSNLALDWRKRIVFKTRLKPGSVSRFDCTLKVLNRKPAITRRPRNGFYIFKNDILDVRVNAATGLVDRYAVAGVNYLTQGAFCPLVLRDNEDPWEVSATAFGPVAGRFRLMDKTKGSRFSGLKNTIESVRVIEDGDVRTVIEAVLAYKESFICQRYALPKQGSEVMVETRVLWNQKNSMLKLELPLAINAKRYLGHTAFGVQTLPMNGTEAVAQKWVCAADDANGLGLTCINDGIYGSDWCGNSIRPSLLRAPAYSAHPVGNAPTCPPDRFSPRIDQGEHIFRFWINAGNIDQRLRAVSAEAQVKNERPYALSFFPKGDGSQPKPVVVLDNQAIELSCLKRAQNDDGWVFRLFNTTDCKQSLRLRLPIAGVRSTCRFGRYEIKTFRLNSDGVLSEVNLLEEEAPDACIYHNTMAGKS
jgi:alpha-mannosidase